MGFWEWSKSNEVEALIVALKKGNRDRNNIVDALVKIGKPAVEPLIAILKDDSLAPRQRVSLTGDLLGDGDKIAKELTNGFLWPRRCAAEAPWGVLETPGLWSH